MPGDDSTRWVTRSGLGMGRRGARNLRLNLTVYHPRVDFKGVLDNGVSVGTFVPSPKDRVPVTQPGKSVVIFIDSGSFKINKIYIYI